MENIKNMEVIPMKFIPQLYLKIALILAPIAALSLYPIYQTFRAQKATIEVFTTPSKAQVGTTLKKITQAEDTLENTLSQQLAEENNRLMAHILDAFPQIHPLQWENAMKAIQKFKDTDELITNDPKIPASDDELITLIYTTLAEYGINPARIEIEYVSTPQSFLSACQGLAGKKVRHIMRVNRKAVAEKSPEVVEAYLRHEIQHLLTYDAIELMIVKDVLEKNEITAAEYYTNPAFIEFKKFKEYRADLLAATKGIDTAQAMMDDMEERIKKYPHEQINPSHATHPTETQRRQALANLSHYLQAEKQPVIA